MQQESIVRTFTFLGPATFPSPVTDLLRDLEWGEATPSSLSETVGRDLGLESVPEYFDRVVAGRDWEDLLDRQLFATLCTFLYAERQADIGYEELGEGSGRYLRFVVSDLPGDRCISLVYPGYKNRFDYDLRVNDWYPDAESKHSPRHWHLFSDFFWKYKQTRVVEDSPTVARALGTAVRRVRDGHPPESVLSDVPSDGFSVGRRLPVLFGILPWFFIEEDINYPEAYYDGKEMPYGVLNRLATLPVDGYGPTEGKGCRYADSGDGRYDVYHELMSDLPNYDTDLQDNCEIVRTAHSIRSECPGGSHS